METPPPSPDAPPEPRRVNGGPWTLPLVLALALAITAALLVKFRQQPENQATAPAAGEAAEQGPNWSPAVDPQSETVSLVIDFGNGARREFAALPWTEGMTVADLVKAAAKFRPGLKYSQQGKGELAFLTSIDGVIGGDPADRYWLYEVNGQPGEVSFAVQRLTAGDRVLWAFKPPE